MKGYFSRFFICLTIVLPLFIQQGYGQSITILAPSSGSPGQNIDVVIRAANTHFKSGVSKVSIIGGHDIEVKNFSVQDAFTAIATFNISSTATLGFRTVMVTTNNENARIENGFEVFAANASLRVNIQALPVESIELSDFDFNNVAASPILFFSNVYNDNVKRDVKIFVFFSGASIGLIGYVNTDKRTLDPNQYYKLSNKDFGHFVSNGNNGNAVVKAIREKGSLPPDEYTYRIEIRDMSDHVIASDETIDIVSNPRSNPELITPGTNFSDEIDKVYTPQPLFQWFGTSNSYVFALYFYTAGQTEEETVRGLPVFTTDNIKGSSFLYPNYAEKLIEGKMYAWQVRGKFPGSKGTQFLPSHVFRFVYSPSGEGSTISKINITPADVELKPGEKIQFNAELLDKENNLVTSVQPVWQITPSKGSITNTGLFTAGSEAANVAVLVKAGGKSEFATVAIKSASVLGNYDEWMIEKMLRQIFGLPPKQ